MVRLNNAILDNLASFICGDNDIFPYRSHRDVDNFFTSLKINATNNENLSRPKFVFEVLRQLNDQTSSSKNLPFKKITRIIEYLCAYEQTQSKDLQKSQMITVNNLLKTYSLELGYIDDNQNIALFHISDEGGVNDGYSHRVRPKYFKRVGTEFEDISDSESSTKEEQKIDQEYQKKTDSIINDLENLLISAVYNQMILNPTLYKSKTHNISDERKKTVKIRDKFICQICMEKFIEEDLEVDHIYPYALGGSHMESNLMAICEGDNQDKGKKLEYYQSSEGRIKLKANIRIFVSSLEIISNFGHWLELINDKRRKTA